MKRVHTIPGDRHQLQLSICPHLLDGLMLVQCFHTCEEKGMREGKVQDSIRCQHVMLDNMTNACSP